uniref:RING-type domain-containing protein n=1 Tax=Globodera rostochiensis TaxID=31243 RepID=A0A914GXB7_GLORO
MSHSLAELGWRTFNFYRLVPILENISGDNAAILQGIDIKEWAPGDDFVLFGEQNGAVFYMTKTLEVRFFKAFQQRLIHFTHSQGLLIAIGLDEVTEPSSTSSGTLSSSNTPILKFWNLNKWKDAVSPPCKFWCQLNFGRKVDASLANFVAISEKLDTIVVGLSNSSLFYHFADFRQECSITKWVQLRESTNPAKDGQLAGVVIGGMRNFTIVSCITDKTVHSYILNPEGNLSKTIVHDAKGCERKCWYYSRANKQLIVAGREMVYFYDINDCLEMGGENGRCHALGRGSDKVQLLERDGQIALIAEQETHIQSNNSKMNTLYLFDIELRYIAFFCSMPSPSRIFTLGGEIYLLNSEGILSKLVEESMENKLEILLKKNLFDLAISIARRGDFDNAIKQYMNTFGFVEPSNIIKKFLDGARISQLCQYLEALHAENLAIGQHTTLLISAYVKLHEVSKLEEWLNDGDAHFRGDGFDADSLIKLLRSAGLFHLASKLALKCNRPQTFLDILCQNTREWERALAFISECPPLMACDFLEIHGPILLEHSEQEALLLIRRLICLKDVDLKKLTKTLANKPRRTEELFGELNLAGELKDPQVRCILFEQRLKSLQESGISPSKAQFEEIVSLLDSDTIERSLLKAYQYNCSPVVVHILRLLNRVVSLFTVRGRCYMWVELISFGTTSKSATRKEDLFALLRKISESNSLNPLIVLEILSRDESLQVGDIRDIVIGWLERQDKSLRENEREIAEQERQLFEMNKEIEDLENNVQVYQVAKCTVCNNHLQVPAIHFLCRHSYHANCFESYSGNRPDECPACAASERKLAESTDVMAFISECLANGQFGTSQQNSGPRKEMPFNPFDEDETT